MKMNINIKNDWKEIITNESKKKYFKELSTFIDEEKENFRIFPPEPEIFQAYNLSSFKKTKVVIIGQDPYHGENQAHGLCFSVKKGNKIPPSLRNIYKELNNDIGCDIPDHGFLKAWAEQGVLMINSVLTVRESQANSHKNMGWETFTQSIIKKINEKKEHVVFILWGNYAQTYEKYLDKNKHCIIKSYHPSPLSASRGFFNTKPFSKTNDYLIKTKHTPIEWCLPSN